MKHLEGGTLLEEVHHSGWALEFDRLAILPVLSLILDCQSNVVGWPNAPSSLSCQQEKVSILEP